MEECSISPVNLRFLPPITHHTVAQRKKRFHSKTRDGCLVCRRRRLKCDEQKPSCIRCLKFNQNCCYEGSSTNLQPILYRAVSLLPGDVDTSHLEFFITNTTDMLCPGPESVVTLASPMSPQDCYARYTRLWTSLVFPMVFTEPQILELVSQLARRHRLALTASDPGIKEHTLVVRTMSKIVETRPVDIVIVGALILFQYESLRSTATMSDSESQGHVHSEAFMKLLPTAGRMVLEYVLPIIGVTRTLHEFCKATSVRKGHPVQVPNYFEDLEEAQTCFADFLRASNLQAALQKWLRATCGLYERIRESDWKSSNALLKLLMEGHMLLSACESSRRPGHEGAIQGLRGMAAWVEARPISSCSDAFQQWSDTTVESIKP